jgi:hypothetical protein
MAFIAMGRVLTPFYGRGAKAPERMWDTVIHAMNGVAIEKIRILPRQLISLTA